MKEKGTWKEEAAGGIDPFKDLRASYEKMVGEKQSMKMIKPKGADIDDKNKKMQTKNIVNVVKTTNRSPKNVV